MKKWKKNKMDAMYHEDVPRDTWKTVRRLFNRLADQKGKLIVVSLATLLSSAAYAAVPLVVGIGIDNLVEAIRGYHGQVTYFEAAMQALGMPLLLLVLASVVSGLLAYLQQYVIASVGEELTLSFRKDVSAKLNRLPLRYFDDHKTGDIMSRITNDLEKVSSVTVNHSSALEYSSRLRVSVCGTGTYRIKFSGFSRQHAYAHYCLVPKDAAYCQVRISWWICLP